MRFFSKNLWVPSVQGVDLPFILTMAGQIHKFISPKLTKLNRPLDS